MNEKKYSLLTNSDIEVGLKNERFKKEDISLIRDREGKIVRHLPLTDFKGSIIPPTLIQINSTYIFQADIRPIIDAIIETKNIELFQDLSEYHQIVIDNLSYYKDHNSRLDELNSKSLDASSVFEKRVERYLNNININALNKVDIESCLTMLDSYLNVIFIYLISTYWIHNSKASSDTIAKRKIKEFEDRVRHIYEQLLAYSEVDKENKNKITMDNSLYARYLLEKENGINEIERLIKHDSRFTSVTDFMSFIKECFFKKKDSYYDDYDQYQVPVKFEISIKLDKLNEAIFNKKSKFALELFNVLEKIEMLKNIHSELVEAGKIDFSTIEVYEDPEANKAFHLTAIPLALHSGR